MINYLARRGYLVLHKDIANHFAGVVVFCIGSALYSITLLRLAGKRDQSLARVHQGLEIFLFVSSVCLFLAFGVVWAIEETHGQHVRHMGEPEDEDQNAYIVEHVAYMIFLLFYATFFLFHTPNPMEPPGLRELYTEEYAHDPEGVAMKPLLHPSIRVSM